MPTVSIITPCYAGEHFLARTIASVRAQTYGDWEHIIVDDGSPVPIAASLDPQVRDESRLILLRQTNAGASAARMAGYAACAAGSRYLLFLDGDDLLEPPMLELLTAYLDTHPQVGMAFSDRTYVDEHDQLIPAYRDYRCTRYVAHGWRVREVPLTSAETPFEALLYQPIALPSQTLIRRTAFEEAGGWDSTLRYHEDTDLWLRLALHAAVHYVPHALMRRRIHETAVSSTPARSQGRDGERRLREKWLTGGDVPADGRAQFAVAWRRRQGIIQPYLWRTWGSGSLRERHYASAMRCYAKSCTTSARALSDWVRTPGLRRPAGHVRA